MLISQRPTEIPLAKFWCSSGGRVKIPFRDHAFCSFCQQHLSEPTRCDQNLSCLPWTKATNGSMYMRAILCTTRVMFSSWTLKFTTRALTSHANTCPPGLLGCNTQLSSGYCWTKSIKKYSKGPNKTKTYKKYPHISCHQHQKKPKHPKSTKQNQEVPSHLMAALV